MRNLILGIICIWQLLIVLSSQLAIESKKEEVASASDSFEPPEIYVDHIINPESDAELEEPQISSLPLDEFENVREKRHTYKILESPGLHSRFLPVQDEDVLKINPHRRRYRRSTVGKSELHSDEVEDVDDASAAKKSEGSDYSFESIVPQAQKQTMNPAYYRSDDSRLMDKWVKAPYGDFQARVHKDEEDSQIEQSSNVKTRTPRVNFITGQQGQSASASGNNDDIKDGPEARERERERERDRDQQNSNSNSKDSNKQSNNDDAYRKPGYNNYPSYNRYDTYDRPVHSPNFYNPYYNNRDYPPSPVAAGFPPYFEKFDPYYYDRYYERNGMLPPPGMSRMTPPLLPSSAFYYRHNYNDHDDYLPRKIPNYYYSDKRFEMEQRGTNFDPHREYLVNEINNRPSRIVYYANLPEIVRTPNNYRSATARYADPMYNNYNYYNNFDRDDYNNARTAKSLPPSTTMRISSTPLDARSIRERNFYG